MYKIVYIPTGHIFELPENTAKDLKESYPNDYKIIEKNGKSFKDKINKKKKQTNSQSIYLMVVEE
jgi:uncharacterized protein involved in exopolysaccharide biosynthesis